jgi:hypothetical protein
VHTRFVPEPDTVIARVGETMGPPEFVDQWHASFVVPETVDVPLEFMAITASAEGWTTPVRIADADYTFVSASGAWYFYAAAPFGELVFGTERYGLGRRIAVWLDDRMLTVLWVDGDMVRLPIWTEPGFHTLRFESLDGCDSYPFVPSCLGVPHSGDCMRAEQPLCLSAAFTAPVWAIDNPATALAVSLDHDLRLRGYDMQVTDDSRTVAVRLFWDADHALPESYALFVHVADPVTGVPAAQYADFPVIPTSEWDGGAAWVSDVRVLLDDLPPGEYAINVGWFIPETGERLGVQGDRPWADADMIFLGTITVP